VVRLTNAGSLNGGEVHSDLVFLVSLSFLYHNVPSCVSMKGVRNESSRPLPHRDVIRSIDGITATPGNVRELLIGDDVPGKMVAISATRSAHQVCVRCNTEIKSTCVERKAVSNT
jgi:hypothetical protein